jgi:ribosomal protein S18 acetylase RimI-like enzyme
VPVAPQGIATRPAVESDWSFIVDCFLRAMQPSLTVRRGQWNEREERDRFEGSLDLDRATVVEIDDLAVGFVVLIELPHVLLVQTIAILPEHQGRGIGSEVIRDVVNLGRQTGRQVVLSVLRVNARAAALYRRLGFEIRESAGEHDHLQFAQ